MDKSVGSTSFSRIMRVAGLAVICLLSGIVGAALVRQVGTKDHSVSYADFISIMLTAISLMMTVLAIFLAVAGFVGWTTIEQKAQTKTEDFLASEFNEGGRFFRLIIETVERTTRESMFEGIQPISDELTNSIGSDQSRKDSR